MRKIGFDSEKYLREQSQYILERVAHYDKLYLEFGGKLFHDAHAGRVLPGYDPDVKIRLLQRLKDEIEVIICLYAGDIERNKINQNLGISYDLEVFKLIDDLRAEGLPVNSVVLTRYSGESSANVFINKLKRRGIDVVIHRATKGYPSDVDLIVSEEGYGQNPYIETSKRIVVVTAPGPNNGKLATCLNQLYHEAQRGKTAGYSKFETFPVWNLPLKHPVNIAYEAATVDLQDINMIDFYHLDAYGVSAVNYNRDIETFPVFKRIIEKITGQESEYQSPTDMGVNRIGFGIIDEAVVVEAAKQEIIRRYFQTKVDYRLGMVDSDTNERMLLIMEKLGLSEFDRKTVSAAREKAEEIKQKTGREVASAVAIELLDGTMITGRATDIMRASASATLNALKHIAKISDEIHLLAPVILEPISKLKTQALRDSESILNLEEILIALSMSAATNPVAQVAFDHLSNLRGTQVHSTTILNANDERVLRSLGMEATSDDEFASSNLYYNS